MKHSMITKFMLGSLGLVLLVSAAGMFGRYDASVDNKAEKTTKVGEKPTKKITHKKAAPMHKRMTLKDVGLHTAMRQLWVEHAVWTHEYLVFATHDIAAEYKKLAAERLLRNQDDIGNAIVPFYGKDAGKKLAALLRDHIMIAVEVVDAAKAGNQDVSKKAVVAIDAAKTDGQDALKKALDKWHANAKDIAAFLHSANPENWSEEALITMLNKHLELTTKEAVALLKGQWADVVTLYDEVIMQLMMMADDLSMGIVKQFPDKFDYQPMRKMIHQMREKMHWNKKK